MTHMPLNRLGIVLAYIRAGIPHLQLIASNGHDVLLHRCVQHLRGILFIILDQSNLYQGTLLQGKRFLDSVQIPEACLLHPQAALLQADGKHTCTLRPIAKRELRG